MTIIKDSNYWKDYNQKRREYLLLKKRESRAKLKELVVDTNNISVVDKQLNNLVVDIKQVVDTNFKSVVDMIVVDRVQLNNASCTTKINTTNEITNEKVEQSQVEQLLTKNVQPKEIVVDQPAKLWKDYYDCLKPYCQSCQQLGIKDSEYAFCSQKQLSTRNYQCLVKHWTIYQSNG